MSLAALFLLAAVSPAKDPAPNRDLVLWYPKPASQWVEALPVGNGRLGAMVFGGAADEHLQFNESTVWTGVPREYQHEGVIAPAHRSPPIDGSQQLSHRVDGNRSRNRRHRPVGHRGHGGAKSRTMAPR